MPRPKPAEPKVPISTRVLQSSKDRLEAMAARREMKLADLLAGYVRDGLTRDEARYRDVQTIPKK